MPMEGGGKRTGAFNLTFKCLLGGRGFLKQKGVSSRIHSENVREAASRRVHLVSLRVEHIPGLVSSWTMASTRTLH